MANLEAELRAAALAAGLVDVDLLPLIKRDGITMGANGTITGIPEAIATFRAAKPSYFRIDVRNLSRGDYAAAVRSAKRDLRRPPDRAMPAATDVRTLNPAAYRAARSQASRALRGR